MYSYMYLGKLNLIIERSHKLKVFQRKQTEYPHTYYILELEMNGIYIQLFVQVFKLR